MAPTERYPLEEKKSASLEQKFLAVQEIARSVGSTLDIDDLLKQIVGSITRLMNAERSSLFMLSDDKEELWTRVLQADEVKEIRLPIGEGIAGWVAEHKEALNIEDAYQDPRFSPEVDSKTGYRTRSVLCVPMSDAHKEITGVVQVLNKRQGTFSDEDCALLISIASQAAIAIENSKLYQSVVKKNEELVRTKNALERRMRERDLLLEMQKQINEATFVDELLERMLKRTSELVGVSAAAILLKEEESERLFFRSASGGKEAELLKLSLSEGQGIAGWVTKHGKSAIVNEPKNDSRHCMQLAYDLNYHPENILCVPLLGKDAVLGAVELLDKNGKVGFEQDDERLLSLIAGSISQALELARYREQMIQEHRLASIGQMLSGVLHDIKTPMTVISGYAQLMAQCDASESRQEYVEQILKQFNLMSAMTHEVLAYARGETTILIRKVYLHRFLDDMRAHLEHEVKGKSIELVVDMTYNGVAFFDEKKFHRVFHNIARNAFEAMPEGGVFTIRSLKESDNLIFEFIDTGVGVPDELRDQLFDPFATSGKKNGTGLGLAIVKKIVEDHEGKIEYTSARNEGTRFRIRLPLNKKIVNAPL